MPKSFDEMRDEEIDMTADGLPVQTSLVPVTPEEEVDNLSKALNRAIKDAAERDAEMALLMKRKAAAEKTIKDLATKRMAKAKALGDKKLLEVAITDFTVGGFPTVELSTGEDVAAVMERDHKSSLFCGEVIVAVRAETIPAFPAFLVLDSGTVLASKKSVLLAIEQTEKHLKKLCLPYIKVPMSVIDTLV